MKKLIPTRRVPQNDSAPAIAILDDALTLLHYGVQEQYRPDPSVLQSARETVRTYLTTLASASIYPAERVPPYPDLTPIDKAGIPVVSKAEFARSLLIATLDKPVHLIPPLLGSFPTLNFMQWSFGFTDTSLAATRKFTWSICKASRG